MTGVAIVAGHCAASALRLAVDGMDVAVLGPAARPPEGIGATGRRCLALSVDPVDEEAVTQAVDQVRSRLGPPAVLVNHLGGPPASPLAGLSHAEWCGAVERRLRSAFLLSRAVVESMIVIGYGRIVTVVPGGSVLHSGVVGFSRTAALELAPFGITVNVLAASGNACDVSTALAFLVGDGAAGVTGQAVGVAG